MTNNFLKNKEKHRFHLVDNSQLPLITSTAAMLLVMSFVFYFHLANYFSLRGLDNTVFHDLDKFKLVFLFFLFINFFFKYICSLFAVSKKLNKMCDYNKLNKKNFKSRIFIFNWIFK